MRALKHIARIGKLGSKGHELSLFDEAELKVMQAFCPKRPPPRLCWGR
jgi:hypothetical protein